MGRSDSTAIALWSNVISGVLLLLDSRRPGRPSDDRRPDQVRVAYRVAPATTTAIGLGGVAPGVGGGTGAFAGMGALIAASRALDRALPYKQGRREHRQ